MIFDDIWVLGFIPVILLLSLLLRKRKEASMRFSSIPCLKQLRPSLKISLAGKLPLLRVFALILIVLALARPRMPLGQTKVYAEGIDIVLAIDSSGSMMAEDFEIRGKRYNRLEVVKKVVKDFIKGRENDRIGMIAFAARAYTVCPLTLDYGWLEKNIERIHIGDIEDGTAIGSALSSSLNRLRDSKAKSKIIILLTDGINNTGKLSPLTVADAAKALGVRVYTIGAGTDGLVPYPMRDMFGRTVYQNVKIELDEVTLGKIAEKTGGQYFRATNTRSLEWIYKEIDSLEKTKFDERGFREYRELFPKFLIPGLILLLMEILLANTVLRKLP